MATDPSIGVTMPKVLYPNGSIQSSSTGSYVFPQQGLNSGTTLTVTSDHGCSSSTPVSVITDSLPIAQFSFTNSCFYDSLNFDASNSFNTESYLWNFGDDQGATVSVPEIDHLYASSSNYTTTLIAESNAGCLDTISHQVVAYSQPTAQYTIPPICFGQVNLFTDGSSVIPVSGDVITTWEWLSVRWPTISRPSVHL